MINYNTHWDFSSERQLVITQIRSQHCLYNSIENLHV